MPPSSYRDVTQDEEEVSIIIIYKNESPRNQNNAAVYNSLRGPCRHSIFFPFQTARLRRPCLVDEVCPTNALVREKSAIELKTKERGQTYLGRIQPLNMSQPSPRLSPSSAPSPPNYKHPGQRVIPTLIHMSRHDIC